MTRAISSKHLEFNPFKRVSELWGTFKAARAQRAEFHKNYAKLQGISASELKEFGLYRSDLPELARISIK